MMRRPIRRALFFTALSFVGGVLASDHHKSKYKSDSPESLLVRTLDAIRAERLDLALSSSDSLVKRQPDFRLAQLVRGDILLAQSGRLEKFGGPRSKDPRAGGMRDEAKVRMSRYASEPPADQLPLNLLQPPADATAILVVDSKASRLYVFQLQDGRWKLSGDHYVSIGLKGFDKQVEGDQRTPLGVYSAVGRIDPKKLDPYYGISAWPLDYPNEWDQQQGRKGHGIWIHGTPLDTYSRPPRASNGCVVLANEDLRTLEPVLATGKTRVLVTDSVQWAPNAEVENLRKSVAGALESWRSDWSTNDMDKYLSHYSDEFRIGKIDLETWERDKRRVAAGKKWIKVTTNDISIFLVPGQTDLAVVDFDQDYKSSNLENHMRKRQYWQRESDGWKILFEGTPKS
ncbi:MAG: hypothetical protein RL173_2237 [Fibrobacterota bacterium]|jgi:murein L,D-transpeptidase YafK